MSAGAAKTAKELDAEARAMTAAFHSLDVELPADWLSDEEKATIKRLNGAAMSHELARLQLAAAQRFAASPEVIRARKASERKLKQETSREGRRIAEQVSLVHSGHRHFPYDSVEWDIRTWDSGRVLPSQRARLLAAVEQGMFYLPGGAAMPLEQAERNRARLTAKYLDGLDEQGRQRVGAGEQQEIRFLIDGLWREGYHLALFGQPKAGKTKVVCDVAGSLRHGSPFLGLIDATSLYDGVPPDERRRLLIVNCETQKDAFEAELQRCGIDPNDDLVTVIHLRSESGGAAAFDLRDPAIYAKWRRRLIACRTCKGLDDLPPICVIVDGATKILHDRRSDTSAFAEWYAEFLRLMGERDVPQSLVSAHSNLKGDAAMGGTESQTDPDNLWWYTRGRKSARGGPAPRQFSADLRLGGGIELPPTNVVEQPGGRLLMQSPRAKQPAGKPTVTVSDEQIDAALVSSVTSAVESGTPLSGRALDEAIAAVLPDVSEWRLRKRKEHLVDRKALHHRKRTARGSGQCWFPGPASE